MATDVFWRWDALGRPWRLAQPIAEIKAWAIANDIPVLGTIGNEEHLTENRPLDHTPFSYTAWPVPLDGWTITAIDLANIRGLGQAIEDLARAGELPWLKYMNHSRQHLDSRDLDGDGLTWEKYPSSDEHVHLSIRTDWQNRTIGHNPFGGVMGILDERLGSPGVAEEFGERWNDQPLSEWLKYLVSAGELSRKAAIGTTQVLAKLELIALRLDALEAGGGIEGAALRVIVREEIDKTRIIMGGTRLIESQPGETGH